MGKLPLFDCPQKGFCRHCGSFQLHCSMQACTNTFGKLQTCYTCMSIVKFVITSQITLTLHFLFTFSAIIFLCIANIALGVLHESLMCHILVRAVCALQCWKIGLWSGDKGRTVYG